MIAFLWAEDQKHLIGNQGQLPWSLPADMAYFKKLTLNHTVVMGRKTYESIPNPPLSKRHNIVLSTQLDFEVPQTVTLYHNLADLVAVMTANPDRNYFVIGGAALFEQLQAEVTDLFVTEIGAVFEGDVFMPQLDYQAFDLVDSYEGTVDEKNKYPHTFKHYHRR